MSECIAAAMVLITGLVIGALFAWSLTYAEMKRDAIKHGAGRYNHANGKFEWVASTTQGD